MPGALLEEGEAIPVSPIREEVDNSFIIVLRLEFRRLYLCYESNIRTRLKAEKCGRRRTMVRTPRTKRGS